MAGLTLPIDTYYWQGVRRMTWPGRTVLQSGVPTMLFRGALVPTEVRRDLTGDNGAPDASIRFQIRDGRPECTEVVIRAKPDGREVRTSDLAAIHLESLAISVFTYVGLRPENDDPGTFGPPDSDSETWAITNAVHQARTSRRGTVTTEDLEEIAELYRHHSGSGAPVKAIAALRGLSERTAARRVQQAREAGILGPAQPGRSGEADPTPKGPR